MLRGFICFFSFFYLTDELFNSYKKKWSVLPAVTLIDFLQKNAA